MRDCYARPVGDCLETLLAVKNLNVAYRSADGSTQVAVENASWEIGAGEVLGLMGESGCGKTSIALALLGLLGAEQAQVSGSIQFRGKELLTMGEREMREIRGSGISMVFQEPGIALNPVMRVREQVAEVIHAHKQMSWEKCQEEAQSALVRVGLPDTPRIFSAYPHQLSGGQRQRLTLAQALACEPALVIADEPTASVDARSQHELLAQASHPQQWFGASRIQVGFYFHNVLASSAPKIGSNNCYVTVAKSSSSATSAAFGVRNIARVQGCDGRRYSSSNRPCSTILPRSITISRSASRACTSAL